MIKQQIKELISRAIEKAYPKMKTPNFNVDHTDEKFGDYSVNAAMILAKQVGERPKEVAKKIIDLIKELDDQKMIAAAEVAGPGFINFKITLPYLTGKILEIIKSGGDFGKNDLGKDLKVNIEFISANPTGPLTLGNGRGGYFGDVLANIFKKYGAEVTREYYINDRGAQVLALGHSVLKDDQAVYKGSYIDEIEKDISHYRTTQYNSENPSNAISNDYNKVENIGQQAAQIITEKYIKKTIAKMGIKFDHWFSEKAMFDAGYVSKMMEHLEKSDLTYKKEGAVWFKTSKYGDNKDRVLITSEGEHTYFASDIAYHFDKIERGYDLLIDFWGADHHGYVARMKAAIEILKNREKWNGQIEIIIAQLVRLMSSDQEVKMSKRAGTFVTLDELIDEVGTDVTRFFFLERNLDTHMDFDLDLAKEHSEKNPVYYVQYACARIGSILTKIKDQKSNIKMTNQNVKLLNKPEEIALIKELIKLPELVEEIVGDYQVQKLAFYARSLAEKFHHFYEKCPVINSGDAELTSARLLLIKAAQIVFKNTLDLLGVSAPEKM